jgi:hypothetical protein
MQPHFPNRLHILGGIALMLFVVIVVRWIDGWGLVTVHVKNAPLGKVIASISRQGHVTIESPLDPATAVTMDVDRVPVSVAIDMLATRIDCSWRVVYLAAPTKTAISEALLNLRSTGTLDEWTTYYYPAPSVASGFGVSEPDPRYLELKIEGPDQDLSKLLSQAAQKSGVMAALPKDWDATSSNLPKENLVRKTIPALVKSAHGKSAELFLITQRRGWGGRAPGDSSPGAGGPPGDGGGGPSPFMGAGGGEEVHPEWLDQRQLAQIAKLTPDQQAEAKKELADRKTLFAEMAKLSAEEKRAKFLAMMNNPDTMQRMMDQQLMRQANQTAEQRINRSVNYLNRKASIQASQASGGAPVSAPMPGR